MKFSKFHEGWIKKVHRCVAEVLTMDTCMPPNGVPHPNPSLNPQTILVHVYCIHILLAAMLLVLF